MIRSDFDSFRTIIRLNHLFQPRMVQSFFSRHPICWVIHEDPLQKVQEIFVERIVCPNDALYS